MTAPRRLAGRAARRVALRLPEPVLRRLVRVRHGEPFWLDRPVIRPAEPGTVPLVVTAYDAHAAREDVVAAVSGALDAAGIAHVRLPTLPGGGRHLAVPAEHRTAALAVLHSGLDGPGWVVEPAEGTRARGLVVHRVLAAPNGAVVGERDSACRVEFWSTARAGSPRRDGGTVERGTRVPPVRTAVPYLSPGAWARASARPDHRLDTRPDALELGEPVDVVYTWVDGEDPAWRARRAEHDPGGGHHATAADASRWVTRDELRYSLRSVAQYAGWVRHVWIVTDGQVPPWLDPSHPRVTVVDHRDVFTDPSVLPVFNSHAIESQLHHIDGLAEHYLYLNDDMFLGRPVEPELFFAAPGVERFFLSKDAIDPDPAGPRDLPAIAAAKNQRDLLEADFGVTVHRKFQHAAHPQLRSVLVEMERRHPELFARVAASRFRHPDDQSIPSSLQHWYALRLGRAVPGTWSYQYQDVGRASTPRALDGLLRRRPQSFCLNDMGTRELPEARLRAELRRFFAEYFPLPAPWERPDA